MMKRKKDKKKFNKGGANSLFNKSNQRQTKSCPLSGKNAPEINYKNLKLLKSTFLILLKFYQAGLQMYL